MYRTILILCISILLPKIVQADSSSDLFSHLNQPKVSLAKIERVVSADTVILETGEKIKLIGLQAPLPPQKVTAQYDSFGFVVLPGVTPETPLEEQAFHFIQKLLEQKSIRLEFDAQRKDQNGITLAYVFLSDGTFANAEILKNGFANLQIQPPNLKYEELLREAYREARQEKRGLQSE